MYKYVECGLDGITLWIEPEIALSEGDCAVVIPKIASLHCLLTRSIIENFGPLHRNEFRYLRTELGMTQEELSSALNVEPSTLMRWEAGKEPIPAEADVGIRLLAEELLERLNYSQPKP